MKTTILHLEEHDDVITVQDRLGWAKSPRALLIWPDEGRILTRQLDLVLLQRTARNQGTQIGLITRDAEVMDHARDLGIPVFRNQKRALHGVWRRKPRRIRWLHPREQKTLPPEELRKSLSLKAFAPLPVVARVGVFLAAILAVGALIMLFIPAATVVLPVEKTTQQMEFPLFPDPQLGGVTLVGGIPVEEIKVEVEQQSQARSTGRLVLSDQAASGEVEFTNLTDRAITIPAGTVVLTTTNPPIRFLTSRAVDLAAGVGKTIQVAVKAESGGTAGNLPAGSLRALEGIIGLQVSVTNLQPTLGGTNQSVTAPSIEDVNRVRTDLLQSLQDQAAERIDHYYVEGYQLIPGTVKAVNILEEEQVPTPGQAGENFSLRLKVEFSGWVVSGQVLHQAARNVMDAGLTPGMVALEDSYWYHFGLLTQDQTGYKWMVTAKRQVQPVLDVQAAAELIAGKMRSRAGVMLRQEFNLPSAPTILLAPAWWPWLPVLPFRIQVVEL